MNIGSLLRAFGLDAHRLGPTGGLTYRLLEHDLPRLAGTRKPIVFDIGANKGQTIELMLRTFERPVIYSFEPSASLASMLQARFASRGVVVESLAMGSQVGERSFIHYANNELSSFLEVSSNSGNPFAKAEEAQRQRVQISTVDHYINEKKINAIDILKIDTQGFELEVLEGASGIISGAGINVIQVEILFEKLYEGQCTAGKLIDWLGERNYLPVTFYESVRTGLSMSWATACFVRPSLPAEE